jgi:DNA-binding FadR family transcriptional regulator
VSAGGLERVLERIAARDVDGAGEEMRLHLADFRRVWAGALEAPDEDPLTAY